ncbi:MAG: hydrogenase maturation protease [Bacteroidota bacterium]|nr:hydrogenase maturation protease [Bacteroidota bacterium]
MTSQKNKILILGLGNDILGDDGIGLMAVRELKKQFEHFPVDVVETALAGFELLDMLQGYEKVLILDAVVTKKHQAGTVLELSPEQFKHATAVSPHYGGLPEVLKLAEHLNIRFPTEIRILAVEIEPPYDLREGLNPVISDAFPRFINKAKSILREWNIS